MNKRLPHPVPAKIIPRIFGGLGNQLFCYAASRRLALVNNAELVLDNVSGFTYDTVYHRNYQLDHFNITCRKATSAERLEPFPRVRRYVKRKSNQHIPFARRKYIIQEGNDFDPRLLHFKTKGTLYLEGYWQSEDYFKDVALILREELQIKPPTDIVNLDMAAKIQGRNSVAVHVRFFDAPLESGTNNTPEDYYTRALAKMDTLVPGSHYFVFSDQALAARTRIPLPEERLTMVTHNQGDENAYKDLWLMTQCRHFIIANSTFSWWGAWLAKFEAKQVIAPGFEKRNGKMSWGFKGMLPEKWLKL